MRQTATYWAPGAPDVFGNVSFAVPVTIKCRWQDKADLFRDANGNQVVSSSVVYPDQAVEVQGYLYLGSSALADPRNEKGAKEIRQVGSSPNLRNTQTLNKAWL